MGHIPTKAETTAGNKFHSYMQGWRDGAAGRAYRHEEGDEKKDPELVAIYLRAYDDGHKEAGFASRRASRLFKYKPSVLRTHIPVSPE